MELTETNETNTDIVVWLLNTIRLLVDHPGAVSVEVVENGKVILLHVRTAASDKGKVIGRQARVVQSIRVLVQSIGKNRGQTFKVDIVDSERT